MQTPKARVNSSGTPPKISPQSISLEVPDKSSPRAASKKHSPKVVRHLKTSPRYSEPTASSLNLASKPSKDTSPNVGKSPRSPLPEEKRSSRVAELESQISQLENDLKNVKDQLCSSETSKKQAQKEAHESSQQLIALSSKQVLELSASQKVDAIELSKTCDEIEQLKRDELNKLRENLKETRLVVEEMKNQLSDCKKSEARSQELVGETLMQLETAKKMVEALRSDGCKATETHDALSFELEQSRARVNFLEDLVSKLKAEESNEMEVEQLRAALDASEKRHNEELAKTTEQMKIAFEMVEKMKSASGQREAELEAELRKSSYEIEELKANLMDKETELQSICDENDALIMQHENSIPIQREYECVKARLKDMETELKNASEENEALKSEIKERNNEVVSDTEAAEREYVMKIGCMKEEMEKSNRKAGRVAEQLEAAQAANAEMEAELRKLKVQCDQWRKAAEVAASMLSVGNNGQLVERTGSMDNNYSPRMRGLYAADDFDEDLMKKKNVNMLKRIGVLWKKPQK